MSYTTDTNMDKSIILDGKKKANCKLCKILPFMQTAVAPRGRVFPAWSEFPMNPKNKGKNRWG